MAKKSAPRDEPAQHESTVPVISETAFRAFLKKVSSAGRAASEHLDEVKRIIAETVEKKHLNKQAFNLWNRLDKMRPDRRSMLLLHFDQMRNFSDWNDQLDLFLKKAAEEEAETEDYETDAPRGNGGYESEATH